MTPTARAAAGLALLPCALLADLITGRAVLYERDIHAYWVPAIESFVRSVAEGSWPLWDPLTNFGRPLLADPNFQLAYPPTWLNLVLSPGAYYTALVVAHAAWAGVGTLGLARAWGLGVGASAWAGAAWILSGPFLSTASLFHHFSSASWMPWVLLALEGVLRAPGGRPAALLAAAAAAMALAGSADICIMTAAICAARALMAVRVPPRPAPKRLVAALACACVLAALLCAVQWWPTLALLEAGSRGAGGAGGLFWSVHPASLLDTLVPGLVAEMPIGPEWRAALFESRGPLLRSLYLGLPVLALAACALAVGRWRLRWFAAGFAAAFLIAALGRFTPVYPLLAGLPVIGLIRFPAKYMIPASLFVALLSGAGLEAARAQLDARGRRRLAVLAGLLALAAAVSIGAAIAAPRLAVVLEASADAGAGTDGAARARRALARTSVLAAVAAGALLLRAARARPPAAALALPLALAGADLFVAGRAALRLAPPEILRHRPPILDAFPRPGEHRLYRFNYGLDWLNRRFVHVPPGWDPEWAWAIGHAERLAPPISTRYRIGGSFDGDFTGLAPRALAELTAMADAVRGRPEGLRLLQMASVTDVISFEESFAGAPPRAERMSVYETPVRVFTVPGALPRAYVVSGARILAPGSTAFALDPGFDPTVEVALEAPASGRAPSGGAAGRARIAGRGPDRITVDVSAAGPSFLVVTESFDPGWRAWVDGERAPTLRANAIFRAVPVPAGDHRVEMRYRPRSVAWGAAATVAGLVAAAALAGRGRA